MKDRRATGHRPRQHQAAPTPLVLGPMRESSARRPPRPAPPARWDSAVTSDRRKALVRRLVNDVINGRDLDLLDELCTTQLAPKLRRAFGQFLAACPDWRQELVEVIAEDKTLVARFRCHGRHLGDWRGLPASGRTMRIDEIYFFRLDDNDRINSVWGLEDTWTADAPARRRGHHSRRARLPRRRGAEQLSSRATSVSGRDAGRYAVGPCAWWEFSLTSVRLGDRRELIGAGEAQLPNATPIRTVEDR